ncbi:MAG: hypothetical protein ACRCVI_01640 [Mycoplasmoidaceae bacterium]
MKSERVKTLINKISSKELHNEESVRFTILSMFAAVPNFINCIPICIEDIKYMIKGCNIFYYDIQENESLDISIREIKKNWENILNSNIIIINNYLRFPDIIIPFQALIAEENKNLFSLIALDEEAFDVKKNLNVFEKFAVKTKINYFSYADKITRLVHGHNGEVLYLPVDEALTKEELSYYVRDVKKVVLPPDIMKCLKEIFRELEKYNESISEFDYQIVLSKERWIEIIALLKACAYLNERKYVNLSDLLILKKFLWSSKDQIKKVTEIIHLAIANIVNDNCSNITMFSNEIMNLLIDMTQTLKFIKMEKDHFLSNTSLIEWNSSFKRIKDKIVEIKYYSREFFDDKNDFYNIFIDEDDKRWFIDLFKIDDKMIFEWFRRLETIIKYINKNRSFL